MESGGGYRVIAGDFQGNTNSHNHPALHDGRGMIVTCWNLVSSGKGR